MTQLAYEYAISKGAKESEKIELKQVDVCIDAMLGIGFAGKVSANLLEIIQQINGWDGRVISIDCPSGLSADTGVVEGSAVAADMTIMLLMRKRGLYTFDAFDYRGELVFDDLGLGHQAERWAAPDYRLLAVEDLQGITETSKKKKQVNVHKYDFGTVLVVGGNRGMVGASILAARACAKVGCGLVMLCVKDSIGLSEENPDFIMVDSKDIATVLSDKKVDTVLVGPGLGSCDWAKRVLKECIQTQVPVVIDADALVLVAENSLVLSENMVITPHAGEAAKMLKCESREINHNRFSACEALQNKYHARVVLKGAGTLIGWSEKEKNIVDFASETLSVAGSGDLLAGMIAGLIAQKIPMNIAVYEAVLIHINLALLCEKQAGGRGMLVSEMLACIPEIKNREGKNK